MAPNDADSPEPSTEPNVGSAAPRPQLPHNDAPDGASPMSSVQPHLTPHLEQPQLPVLSLSAEEDSDLKRLTCLSEADSSPPPLADDKNSPSPDTKSVAQKVDAISEQQQPLELRFLVRRREAGALIGKRGLNIKRLRETFRSSMFSIPDTGNGPERVVCIVTNEQSLDAILGDLTELLMEKSPENDEQIELKILIHSSHAGSIIGIGGQSIKKLRNDSKAAIKIYEMCCPLSNERVCAIKAKPPVVVSTIKLIQSILRENPTKGTVKPYDALHFDLNLVDKYGGYLHDDAMDLISGHHHHFEQPAPFGRPLHDYAPKRYSLWRSPDFRDTCEIHDGQAAHLLEGSTCHLDHQHHPMLRPEMSAANKGAFSPNGDAAMKQRDNSDCQKSGAQAMPSYPQVRLGRFHPYAMRPNLDFATYARPLHHHHHHQQQLPPPYLRFHYGAALQPGRNPYLRVPAASDLFADLPDRCRHARPCSCQLQMSSNHLPAEVVSAATAATPAFMQLVKNFNHSRGSPHNSSSSSNGAGGYKKK